MAENKHAGASFYDLWFSQAGFGFFSPLKRINVRAGGWQFNVTKREQAFAWSDGLVNMSYSKECDREPHKALNKKVSVFLCAKHLVRTEKRRSVMGKDWP